MDSRKVRDAPGFWLAWGACTAAGLAPLWAFRFLPMQDYPQHLFYSFVLATWSLPDFNWATHYQASLSLGPYTLFYALTSWLIGWVGAESAGRIVVSTYVLALSAYIAVEARDRPEPPWPLLLLIPLGFSQPYYMGFTNYFLAIPLLLFALRSHSQLLEGGATRPGPWLGQLICGVLLFFAHLSMIFVYVGLAALRVARRLPGERPWAAAIAPAAIGLLLVAWLTLAPRSQELQEFGEWSLRWWPFSDTLAYLSLPFTGMRISEGVRASSLLAWFLVGAALVASLWQRLSGEAAEPASIMQASNVDAAAGSTGQPPSRARILDERIDLAAAIFACLALPFWLAHYSYVNLRLAPVVYLLAAIALARLNVSGHWRAIFAVGVLGLCFTTWTIHRESDSETAELIPLLNAMQPNQPIHALYPDASSRALDPKFFYQHHSHEHTYYHVLRGGGVSPTLFPTELIPVLYRDAARIPFARHGEEFELSQAAGFYTYLLVRGGGQRIDRSLRPAYLRIGISGAWRLYRRLRRPPNR